MCNVPLDNHNQNDSIQGTQTNDDLLKNNHIYKDNFHDSISQKTKDVPTNIVLGSVTKQNDPKIKIISEVVIAKPSGQKNDKMCYGNNIPDDVNISNESSVISMSVSELRCIYIYIIF